MAEIEEDIPDRLPVEEGDEEEGEFDWVVDEADELDEDDEDVVVLDTEAEPFELEQPAERSGHIAAVDGHYMYVWGGYKNSQTTGFFDLYLPRNEIWIYNMETERWKKQMTVGNLHTSMSGSCGVCVDGVLYLFGGHHARGNTDRVFRLPLRTPALCWEEMKDLKGLAPSCKDKLGCWVHKNRLVFFGGYGYMAQGAHRGTFEYDETSFMGDNPGRGWNNHIHILDLETSTWSQPVTKGNAPSPRAAHACAKVGNRGYVFGGRYRVMLGCTVSARTSGSSSSTITQRAPGSGTRPVPVLVGRCLCSVAVPTTCCPISELLTAKSCWSSQFNPSHLSGSVWKQRCSTESCCLGPGTVCLNICYTLSDSGWEASTPWAHKSHTPPRSLGW
uniref:Kelch domain containing 2 n=1 Tax=Salmo trutta TaxID=8032 RepID=A0A674A5U8_SALTR